MATKSKFLVKHGLAVNTQSGSSSTLNYPTADGTVNQVIKTDGSGNLSFDSAVSSFINLTDTPVNYTSAANKTLIVDSTGSKIEFSNITAQNNVSRESFTASGDSNVITLANTYVGANYVMIFVDGVIQFPGTNFSLDSTILTFTATPDSAARIEVFGQNGSLITVPGDTTVSAAKLTNPLALPDNHKITFGDGPDLEIYHDGTHSYVADIATGRLRLLSNGTVIRNANNNADFAEFTSASVDLYQNGTKRFETTDSGATVTGSLIADSATFKGTTAIQVPAGTTGQRPSAATGQIRFNSNLTAFEGYDGTAWSSLGGLIDADQDTNIIAERAAGTDSDTLKFLTGGTIRMTLDSATLSLISSMKLATTNIQLTGDSNAQPRSIYTLDSANIDLDPSGSGKVVFKGNATKGSGQFVLNCENNSHGIIIKGPPHSASASYTLTLPDSTGYSGGVLKTNGSGNLSWTTDPGTTLSIRGDSAGTGVAKFMLSDGTYTAGSMFEAQSGQWVGDNRTIRIPNMDGEMLVKKQASGTEQIILNGHAGGIGASQKATFVITAHGEGYGGASGGSSLSQIVSRHRNRGTATTEIEIIAGSGNNSNIKLDADSCQITGLLRMDSTGSPVSLQKSGSTFGGRNLLIRGTGGYVQIGPLNGSFSHFSTDRDKFWFNKPIHVDGNLINAYDGDFLLQRVGVTKLKLEDSGADVTGRLKASGGSLDSSAGSEVDLLDLHSTVVNGSRLRVFTKRDSAGTGWSSAYTRIQQRIDVSDQSYIQFNGADNSWGMELGSVNDKFIRMVRNGAVEIYHDDNLTLITTATGVNVTGSVTNDGLVVDGEIDFVKNANSGPNYMDFYGTTFNLRNYNGNRFNKLLQAEDSAGVTLYHNDSSRLITTATGVDITGALTATTKSFDIEHPTKEGMRLRYGSLEGPENGVYVRGKLENSNIIELPDYWTGLVDENTITVSLTPIGKYNEIWVDKIEDNKVYINSSYNVQCFYHVFGERKDVDKLQVEYE